MSKVQYIKQCYDFLPKEIREILQHTELSFDPNLNHNVKSKEDIISWITTEHPSYFERYEGSIALNNSKKKT